MPTVFAGALAGLAIAVPVGAIGVLIVLLSARCSWRVGVAAGLGTASADGLYALLAAVAGDRLAPLVRPVADPLRWVAALVLIVLAVRGLYGLLRSGGNADGLRIERPLVAYRMFLGLTLLNPMTVVYFAALIMGGSAGQGPGWVFALAAFAASACWQILLALGGRAVGATLTGERGRLITGLLGNALILYFAVRLLAP
ncbi:lysine transporter LysE [Pseudonocardiaceae bacterium YIM PH 21723]|nr:lysine transporter LysE [Pseudonocardiaceae bacterium YIM PH 21723]